MKKKLFKNAFQLMLGTLLLIAFTGISCKKTVVQPVVDNNSNEITSANLRKSNTYTEVLLSVTLSNNYSDGTACNIQSDANGPYVNGSQNVSAVIDQYGNFLFNTQASSNPRSSTVLRWFNYNFSQPLSGYSAQNINVDHTKMGNFNMIKSNLSTLPFIPLQNLGINGNPTTECVTLGGGFSSTTTDYRVSFHRGAEDVSTSASSLVFVTRTKVKVPDGIDEWTITPAGCSGNQNVGALRTGDGSTLIGYYSLPFYFTLTAVPL
jgi:hypothetical protein